MTGLVALCADRESLQHPEALGLAGEGLTTQEWLRVFTSAVEARAYLERDRLVDEVWVASCDDVEPINLAATLKRDRPDRCVCLLAFQGTGSLWSRANAAGIDASLTRQAFVARYGQRKRLAACAIEDLANRQAERDEAYKAHERALAALKDAEPASGRDGVGPSAASGAAAHPAQLGAARGADAAAAQTSRTAPTLAFPAGAVSARLAGPGARPAQAFVLPVVSGGGGVGKSTIAALCALLSQERGLKTLLLDFDLQFGDMARMMGQRGALTVSDALAVPARLDRLAPDGRTPALLAAPERLELSEAVGESVPELLDALSERFAVIVVNTGASWAEQHAALLERSSKALFLVDQRPSSLEACQHALELCARCGIASGPFAFAVNRCSKRALFTSVDVACTLHVQHVYELAEGGRDVEELLGSGAPFELLDGRNALVDSVDAMLDELLPAAEGVEAARPARAGLLARLFGGRKEREP